MAYRGGQGSGGYYTGPPGPPPDNSYGYPRFPDPGRYPGPPQGYPSYGPGYGIPDFAFQRQPAPFFHPAGVPYNGPPQGREPSPYTYGTSFGDGPAVGECSGPPTEMNYDTRHPSGDSNARGSIDSLYSRSQTKADDRKPPASTGDARPRSERSHRKSAERRSSPRRDVADSRSFRDSTSSHSRDKNNGNKDLETARPKKASVNLDDLLQDERLKSVLFAGISKATAKLEQSLKGIRGGSSENVDNSSRQRRPHASSPADLPQKPKSILKNKTDAERVEDEEVNSDTFRQLSALERTLHLLRGKTNSMAATGGSSEKASQDGLQLSVRKKGALGQLTSYIDSGDDGENNDSNHSNKTNKQLQAKQSALSTRPFWSVGAVPAATETAEREKESFDVQEKLYEKWRQSINRATEEQRAPQNEQDMTALDHLIKKKMVPTSASQKEDDDEELDSTVQNILQSIGFNFDLSKRMQELAREKKKQQGALGTGIINETASFLEKSESIVQDVRDALFSNKQEETDFEDLIKEARASIQKGRSSFVRCTSPGRRIDYKSGEWEDLSPVLDKWAENKSRKIKDKVIRLSYERYTEARQQAITVEKSAATPPCSMYPDDDKWQSTKNVSSRHGATSLWISERLRDQPKDEYFYPDEYTEPSKDVPLLTTFSSRKKEDLSCGVSPSVKLSQAGSAHVENLRVTSRTISSDNDEPFTESRRVILPSKSDKRIVSRSPVLRGSRSPVLRGSRSPVNRNSLSPISRTLRSPIGRGSRSPVNRNSLSPISRKLRSPIRRGSLSPISRKLRSPIGRGSRSPVNRNSLSPISRKLQSPIRRGSLSPINRKLRSPIRRGSLSPINRKLRSPIGRGSRSPVYRDSRSPIYKGSRSPVYKGSRSPVYKGSRSPVYKGSRSPVYKRLRSPVYRKSRSPDTKFRKRSASPLTFPAPKERRLYSDRSDYNDPIFERKKLPAAQSFDRNDVSYYRATLPLRNPQASLSRMADGVAVTPERIKSPIRDDHCGRGTTRKSPDRRKSRSPFKRKSKSPGWHRSRSPKRRRSNSRSLDRHRRSPERHRSLERDRRMSSSSLRPSDRRRPANQRQNYGRDNKNSKTSTGNNSITSKPKVTNKDRLAKVDVSKLPPEDRKAYLQKLLDKKGQSVDQTKGGEAQSAVERLVDFPIEERKIILLKMNQMTKEERETFLQNLSLRQARVSVLKLELEKLEKEQNEIMRKCQRGNNEDNNPLLMKSIKALMKLENEIKKLSTAEFDTHLIHSKSPSKSPPPSHTSKDDLKKDVLEKAAVSKKKVKTSTDINKAISQTTSESKEAKEKPQVSSDQEKLLTVPATGLPDSVSDLAKEKDKPDKNVINSSSQPSSKQNVYYEYYDSGNHWCKHCSCSCGTLVNLFQHLHGKKHIVNTEFQKRPWRDEKKKPLARKVGMSQSRRIKGVEMVLPVIGSFCTLCKIFCGDLTDFTEHMATDSHYDKYMEFVGQNPLYEKTFLLEKTAAMAKRNQLPKTPPLPPTPPPPITSPPPQSSGIDQPAKKKKNLRTTGANSGPDSDDDRKDQIYAVDMDIDKGEDNKDEEMSHSRVPRMMKPSTVLPAWTPLSSKKSRAEVEMKESKEDDNQPLDTFLTIERDGSKINPARIPVVVGHVLDLTDIPIPAEPCPPSLSAGSSQQDVVYTAKSLKQVKEDEQKIINDEKRMMGIDVDADEEQPLLAIPVPPPVLINIPLSGSAQGDNEEESKRSKPTSLDTLFTRLNRTVVYKSKTKTSRNAASVDNTVLEIEKKIEDEITAKLAKEKANIIRKKLKKEQREKKSGEGLPKKKRIESDSSSYDDSDEFSETENVVRGSQDGPCVIETLGGDSSSVGIVAVDTDDVGQDNERIDAQQIVDVAQSMEGINAQQIVDVGQSMEGIDAKQIVDVGHGIEGIHAQQIVDVGQSIEGIDAQQIVDVGQDNERIDAQQIVDVGQSIEGKDAQQIVDVGQGIEGIDAQQIVDVGQRIEELDVQQMVDVDQSMEGKDAQQIVDVGQGMEGKDAQQIVDVGQGMEGKDAQQIVDVGQGMEGKDAQQIVDDGQAVSIAEAMDDIKDEVCVTGPPGGSSEGIGALDIRQKVNTAEAADDSPDGECVNSLPGGSIRGRNIICCDSTEKISFGSNLDDIKDNLMIADVMKQEERIADNVTNQEERIADNVTNQEESIADNVTSQEESIADNVTSQEESIADNVTRQETNVADNVTRQETNVADNVTRQETNVADNVTRQENSIPDNVTNQEESVPDNVRQEATVADNVTKQESFADNVTKQESFADIEMIQEENIADNVARQEESIADNVARQEESIADNVTSQEESIADNVTSQEERIADNVTRQEESIADNVTRQEESIADNVTRQETNVADNVTRQEESIADNVRQETNVADNVTRQEESIADNVRQETNVADNVTRQEESIADNVVRQEESIADNVRQETNVADNVTRQEESIADNVVRQEESIADNVRQETNVADNVTRQEESIADNVRQETNVADNVTRQEESIADNVVRHEESVPYNVTRQETNVADNVTRQEESIADNVVRHEESVPYNVTRQETNVADNVTSQEESIADNEIRQEEHITDNVIDMKEGKSITGKKDPNQEEISIPDAAVDVSLIVTVCEGTIDIKDDSCSSTTLVESDRMGDGASPSRRSGASGVFEIGVDSLDVRKPEHCCEDSLNTQSVGSEASELSADAGFVRMGSATRSEGTQDDSENEVSTCSLQNKVGRKSRKEAAKMSPVQGRVTRSRARVGQVELQGVIVEDIPKDDAGIVQEDNDVSMTSEGESPEEAYLVQLNVLKCKEDSVKGTDVHAAPVSDNIEVSKTSLFTGHISDGSSNTDAAIMEGIDDPHSVVHPENADCGSSANSSHLTGLHSRDLNQQGLPALERCSKLGEDSGSIIPSAGYELSGKDACQYGQLSESDISQQHCHPSSSGQSRDPPLSGVVGDVEESVESMMVSIPEKDDADVEFEALPTAGLSFGLNEDEDSMEFAMVDEVDKK